MNPWSDFTVDHMDPQIQGGGDELPNLVPCCKTCNSRKGGKTVIEYKEYLASKNEHVFWFEHDETLMEAYDDYVAPIDEEAEIPDQMPMQELKTIVYFCMRLGGLLCNTGLTSTLIYLLEDGMDNYQEDPEEEGYFIQWGLDLGGLARITGQAVDHILSHIFFLQSRDIIAITDNNPKKCPIYTLHTDRIQQVVNDIYADRRKTRDAKTQ